MGDPGDTFDFRTRDPGSGPDQTLRPDRPFSGSETHLPVLSIGEALPADLPGGPDLRVVDHLGEGGMGIVLLARQTSLDRDVAIKRLRPEVGSTAAAALLREARFMGRLEHPNIVPVHALGLDDTGRPVLVMKRIEGVSWRTLIREPDHPWWQPEDAEDPLARHLAILMEVCRAVHFAHSRGVLHRDLKPENIMIGAFGEVLLVDWGVATRLGVPAEGGLAGTPSYMAPEMLEQKVTLTAATDVYLLGACLHEVLTGQSPRGGPELEAVLDAARDNVLRPLPDDTPLELAAIAQRACAADPKERPASAEALRQELAAFLRHRSALGVLPATHARLALLEAEIASPSPDRSRTEALFAECRFGFEQVLEIVPGHPEARDGLGRACLLKGSLALAAGDLDGAQTHLDRAASLGAPVDAQRESIAAARRERERLRQLAIDQDTTVGSRGRVALVLVMLLISILVTGWVFYDGLDHYDYGAAIRLAVGLLVSVALVIGVGSRWVMATATNRALAMAVLGGGVLVVAHRVIAANFLVPMEAMLAVDLLIISAAVAVIGVGILPRLLPALPIYLLGVLAVVIWPAHAVTLFGVVTVAGMGVILALAALAWRSGEGRDGR